MLPAGEENGWIGNTNQLPVDGGGMKYTNNTCEWCGKSTLYLASQYREDPDYYFVLVYDKEHCICYDCYKRLE